MDATGENPKKKQRNDVLDGLLSLWMTLSMVSMLPAMFFGGRFIYVFLTTGAGLVSPTGEVLLPVEAQQDLFIFFGLFVNYVIFKCKCTVGIHPRLGPYARLKSQVESFSQ